jgi:hypothetical protein
VFGLNVSQPPYQNCADDNDKQNNQLQLAFPLISSLSRCVHATVTERNDTHRINGLRLITGRSQPQLRSSA